MAQEGKGPLIVGHVGIQIEGPTKHSAEGDGERGADGAQGRWSNEAGDWQNSESIVSSTARAGKAGRENRIKRTRQKMSTAKYE